MRSAARRNETANYRLEMIAGDGGAPATGRSASARSDGLEVQTNACLDEVARQTGDRNVVLLSSEYSEANSLVMVGVGAQRAPWRCLVSNDGQVAEITFEGDDSAGVSGSQAMAGANVLADSEWRPMTIGGGGVPDGANPIIRFQDDGTVAGYTGCNRFTGSYSISGDRIDIGPLATTKMACPDLAMNLEDRILASLDHASTFVRDRANLTLRDDGGAVVATLIGSGGGLSGPSESPGGAEAIPNYERPVGGVMPEGSSFSATGQIKCVRDRDAADAMCDFGVVRESNGNGWMMVFWPDGGSRAIFFENGTPVRYDESEADGGAKMTVTRDGDTSVVFVGESRFEIPDAAIYGG
jgi:heat shock protein HslJ